MTSFVYPNGWNFVGGWSWAGTRTLVGDFNGDGREDFTRIGATYCHIFVSAGDGSFYWPVYPYGLDLSNGFTPLVGDFDGDGKSDIIMATYTYLHGFFSRGSDANCWQRNGNVATDCFLVKRYNFPPGWYFSGDWDWTSNAVRVLDINGDGKMDFINLGGGTYNHQFISK